MSGRTICQRCHVPVDPEWDAHDGGSDDMGRETWYCADCCPLCRTPPHTRHDARRVDL